MAKETNQDNAQNNTQTENGNNTNAGRIGTSITPEGGDDRQCVARGARHHNRTGPARRSAHPPLVLTRA